MDITAECREVWRIIMDYCERQYSKTSEKNLGGFDKFSDKTIVCDFNVQLLPLVWLQTKKKKIN